MDLIAPPLEDIKKIQKVISTLNTSRVWSQEVRSHLKAVGFAWFNSYRQGYLKLSSLDALSNLDSEYKILISSAEGAPYKKAVHNLLKRIYKALIELRKQLIDRSLSALSTSYVPPSFGMLVSDPFMQQVLEARWRECTSCIEADAPVASIVMMGGLLESLLLARVNRETEKQPIFQAKSAPKNRELQTLPLKDWKLGDYIDVAYELHWISELARDIGEVLRNYRNFIHPYKQAFHKRMLNSEDAKVLWEVFKTIAYQLI